MDYTSIRVGQLQTDVISGGNFIPHEVAGILKKATITDLAAFIGASDAVGFRAVSVENGGTLPDTDTQEFILVGPGSYNNVGGGSVVTVTEELNALVSNGTFWFVGVEISIDAPPGNAIWGEIIGTLSNQTDLMSFLALKADLVDGKVPSSQLPSYVDDVIEVANFAALPVTGETGKIYVTLDTGFIYRWSGSAYIRISNEAASWGTIVGTLSNQTDLQTALNTKALKTTAINTTAPLSGGGDLSGDRTLSIAQSNGSTNGFLSSTDWTTFNAKQNALNGTGFVKISGTTISYDNNTYALDSVVVKLTGNQTIAGIKSFSSDAIINDIKIGRGSGNVESNTMLGYAVGFNNTTGSDNSFFGYNSGYFNTTGLGNTFLGRDSGQKNTGGNSNSAVGYYSLGENTTGGNNISFGYSAGRFIGSSGSSVNGICFESIFLGAQSRANANNQSNQIVIGYAAVGVGSNSVVLGNDSITKTILKGNVGIGTGSPSGGVGTTSTGTLLDIYDGTNVGNNGGALVLSALGNSSRKLNLAQIRSSLTDGTVGSEKGEIIFSTMFNASLSIRMRIGTGGDVNLTTLGTGLVYSNSGTLQSSNPSDSRLKEDITDLQYGLNEILQLRPVSYNWKNDTINQGKQFGFIAQEVQDIMPDLVKEFETKDGDEEVLRLGLDKEGIFVAMVNAIKELKLEIELLKAK